MKAEKIASKCGAGIEKMRQKSSLLNANANSLWEIGNALGIGGIFSLLTANADKKAPSRWLTVLSISASAGAVVASVTSLYQRVKARHINQTLEEITSLHQEVNTINHDDGDSNSLITKKTWQQKMRQFPEVPEIRK